MSAASTFTVPKNVAGIVSPVSFAPASLLVSVLRVPLSEVDAIEVNVDDGVRREELALSVLASEVKRIEERGIFKAHLTQTPV